MYWAVWWVVPVVLLQAAHPVENVLVQVSAENNSWDNVSPKDLPQNVKSGNNKPHIVLMVADDLGWHDVSWHNPKVHTPNLGNLATTGVILNQSYVMHICTPSRSALMTGRYPFTIGRQHGVIHPLIPVGLTMNATLLPEELKKLGYSTHIVGKWHLGFCNWKYTPTKRGFDTFYGYYNGAEDYYTHRRECPRVESEDGDYCINIRNTQHATDTTTASSNLAEDQVQEAVNTQTESDPRLVLIQEGCVSGHGGYDFRNNTSPDFAVEETYSTYVFASYIEDLLKTRDSSDPMFLYIPFQSVHAPLQVPAKYLKRFKYVKDQNRRTYMGMLSALDEAVGRIVRALKETGHYNNSIIVFTTDNGGQTRGGGNNWPLRGKKATLWEGGTRGSAFVHSPLLNNKGTVSNQLVHVSDWFSTLLGVAGGDIPEGLDSIDQWEAIAGNEDPPRDKMIYNLDDSEGLMGGIRIGEYKLLLGKQGFDEWVPPPEGLPKEILKENTTEDVTEKEYNTNINTTTTPNFNNIRILEDITTENIVTNKLIKTNNKRKLNIKRKQKRRLRNKEKLKQKIRREKIAFQNMFSIKSDDNNIFNGNSFTISTEEGMKNKEQKSSTGQHLTVDQAVQSPFIVKAIMDPLINYTSNVNISDHPRDRPSPMTFDDLLTWTVEDLVNYKKLHIRLFNMKDDPTEHHDLADNNPGLVKELLGQLLLELPRLVQPEVKPNDHRGNPKYWDNIWSPGWC